MFKSTLGILALGMLGGVIFGCGGDDSSGGTGSKADYAAQCKRLCAKSDTCQEECPLDCGVIPESVTNCNFPKVRAKVDECTKGACGDLFDCISEIPEICPQVNDEPPGTGGANGSGGATSGGSGGATSGDSCAVCTKAVACCKAVYAEYTPDEDPADCDSMAEACTSAPASQKSVIIDLCNSTLSSGKQISIAACN
jgi:hypothetical protein